MDGRNCTLCGKPVLGGHDQVAYLESPVMSFHLVQHLECRLRQEREDCAKACEAEADLSQGPGIAKFGDHYAAIIRARNNSNLKAETMTPTELKSLAFNWSNTPRDALEDAGIMKRGQVGGSDWKRFNDDPMMFILKLPSDKLEALAKVLTPF
jgi:hypothetical protein